MTVGDLKQKDSEPKSQLIPEPIIQRIVDILDLPSQYTEDIETFRQVLNIPDPRDSMPVSSASVWGLNEVAQQRELRPKGPSAMLPLSPTLKEALDRCGKFATDRGRQVYDRVGKIHLHVHQESSILFGSQSKQSKPQFNLPQFNHLFTCSHHY